MPALDVPKAAPTAIIREYEATRMDEFGHVRTAKYHLDRDMVSTRAGKASDATYGGGDAGKAEERRKRWTELGRHDAVWRKV